MQHQQENDSSWLNKKPINIVFGLEQQQMSLDLMQCVFFWFMGIDMMGMQDPAYKAHLSRECQRNLEKHFNHCISHDWVFNMD